MYGVFCVFSSSLRGTASPDPNFGVSSFRCGIIMLRCWWPPATRDPGMVACV